MRFKLRLATFVSTLMLASSSLANQEIPAVCPNMTSIQSEGLAFSLEIMDGFYFAYNSSHYNTGSNWIFILGLVKADSNESAINTGNQLLSTFTIGNQAPQQDNDGYWFCQYESGIQDLVSYAVQADDMISPLKMARLLRKPL